MGGQMSRTEFVALMAMMFAMIALSIDAMLPALPEIGHELSPDNLNAAQMVIFAFVIGMGVGTFITGPLSDSFGRKPVILWGCALYIVGALLSWKAQSLEMIFVARLVQGLGVAGPRVVGAAIVRDKYAGRGMAKIMSFVMMVFALVPALAPLMGMVVINLYGWREIFLAFVIFCVVIALWLGTRLEETLPKENRRPFSFKSIWTALKEMFAIPAVTLSLIMLIFGFAILMATISSVQQIYDITFGHGDEFAWWFGGVAILAASASVLNAAYVERLGMRYMTTIALVSQVFFSGAMIVISFCTLPQTLEFYIFVFWQLTLFFMVGLTFGNLNAMAMEPLGHIAGIAASILGGVTTVVAIAFAAPIGLAFDGSYQPLAIGAFLLSCCAVLTMLRLIAVEKRTA